MKKTILSLMLVVAVAWAVPAYADIWGDRPQSHTNMKLSATASEAAAFPVDPSSLLGYLTAAANRLGVREGVIYDRWGFANYAAATAYTLPNVPIAFDFGAVNTDGIAATVDYNIGASVPAGSDPLTSLLQYLYAGGGLDYRDIQKSDSDPTTAWRTSWAADVQFKGTW